MNIMRKENTAVRYADKVKAIINQAQTEVSILVGYEVKLTAWVVDPIGSGMVDRIRDTICFVCDVTRQQVESPSRKREVVVARHLYFHFMKKYTNMTLKEIGKTAGERDHSTVIHALQVVMDRIDVDDRIFCKPYRLIEQLLSDSVPAIIKIENAA